LAGIPRPNHTRAGQTKKAARPHYERVVKLHPNHGEARERLRQLESAEKKKDHPEVSLLGRLLSRLSK